MLFHIKSVLAWHSRQTLIRFRQPAQLKGSNLKGDLNSLEASLGWTESVVTPSRSSRHHARNLWYPQSCPYKKKKQELLYIIGFRIVPLLELHSKFVLFKSCSSFSRL